VLSSGVIKWDPREKKNLYWKKLMKNNKKNNLELRIDNQMYGVF
jgi:hypothetical protein